MGERRVDAYAQDLSITGFEFLSVFFEAAEFPLSTAGKIERVKCQDNVLFALVIFQ